MKTTAFPMSRQQASLGMPASAAWHQPAAFAAAVARGEVCLVPTDLAVDGTRNRIGNGTVPSVVPAWRPPT